MWVGLTPTEGRRGGGLGRRREVTAADQEDFALLPRRHDAETSKPNGMSGGTE